MRVKLWGRTFEARTWVDPGPMHMLFRKHPFSQYTGVWALCDCKLTADHREEDEVR